MWVLLYKDKTREDKLGFICKHNNYKLVIAALSMNINYRY